MKKSPILFGLSLSLLASCGSDDSAPAASATVSSDFNAVYERLRDSAPAMASSLAFTQNNYDDDRFVKDEDENFVEKKKITIMAAITDNLWNPTTSTQDDDFMGVGSTSTNLQGFVTNLMDESYDQSIFDRARMPFVISCCLDILAPKTGSLFTDGTHSITFPSSIVGVCGSQALLGNMVGQTISIQVSTLSTANQTNYDQKIFFDHNTNPAFSEVDQYMYIRNNATTLNFAHIEKNVSSGDVFASTIAFNKSTYGGSFQYGSKGTNENTIFRIFMDPANDDARILAYKKAVGTGMNATLTMASTFSNQTHVALSASWASQQAGGAYATDTTNANACIATSTASIQSDNTLTCSTNSKTVTASGSATTPTAAIDAVNTTTLFNDAASGAFYDNLPTFTNSTIFTAGLGL